MSLGLYLHIPYCFSKCRYCDFYSAPGQRGVPPEYPDALLRELHRFAPDAPLRPDTIYFGGGTPSLLTPGDVARLMEAAQPRPGAEITLEANPETVTEETLRGFRAAGVNRVSGQIISSTFDGKVQATNATGGIAGLNEGIIRHCTNTGSINTNNVDASLSLSDIQIDTTLDLANLTTSQTFLTTTETGGIAGTNTGLIAGCKNTGTVGYEHVGYNIGGIAGSTSGYLRSNTNEGTILGRKDVGGIAGQVEPYVAVTVSESTKDQLQTQLQDLRTLTDRATADAGGAASSLGS